jgi:protein-S-isoprenylcysteine O-methyltransferase Ste14
MSKALAVLGTVIFTILAPGTVTVVVPYLLLASRLQIFAVEIGTLRFFGSVPIIAGVLIYSWCAWDFAFSGTGTPAPIAPPKQLVIRGLYRYVRNPMYVGVLLVLFGEALLFESVELFLYAFLVFFMFRTFVVYYEEPTLSRRFTDSYRRYCGSVPRWIPKF